MAAGRDGPGWVYVMTHSAWSKIGMVKIGMTKHDPTRRLKQITSSSGLLAAGKVHHCVWVSNRYSVERVIHARLDRYRVNPRREFFRVRPEIAVGLLNEVSTMTVPNMDKPPLEIPVFQRRAEAKSTHRSFEIGRPVAIMFLIAATVLAVVVLIH